MGLADIGSIPRSRADLDRWSFLHQAAHVDINAAIFRRFGILIPNYILDPIDPNNDDVFQYQHQLIHTEMDQILGIAGNNLLGVDWNNEAILESWIFLHLPEHQQAAAALGL